MKTFIKRFSLFIIALGIIQLSNTPNLRVSEPKTWISEPKYEVGIPMTVFLNTESDFYRPYKNITEKEFLLHKASHITFYSLITFLMYINIPFRRFRFLTTWVGVVVFAFLDEFHQFYVVGRSGRLADVALDSTASLLIIICMYLVVKKRNQKENHSLA